MSVERRCSRGVQLMMRVVDAADHAAEAWEAAVSATECWPAVWRLTPIVDQLLRAIASDACEHFPEAVSVARLCSRGVQRMMSVLEAADHAAEAWEAAVSAYQPSEPIATVTCTAPP